MIFVIMSGLLLLREFWRTKQFIILHESHYCQNKKMMLCIVPQASFSLFQDSRCLADRRPHRTNDIIRDTSFACILKGVMSVFHICSRIHIFPGRMCTETYLIHTKNSQACMLWKFCLSCPPYGIFFT